MTSMFQNCGAEAMTVLDLGPKFIKIAYEYENFISGCGNSDIIIYAPESIYAQKDAFKLNKRGT